MSNPHASKAEWASYMRAWRKGRLGHERGNARERRAADPERARKYALAWLFRRRGQIDELKARPCQDCGNHFPPECMDFDHVRGEKKFMVSANVGSSWSATVEEIAKCDVVCSNCHRIRTRKRRRP